MPRNLEAVPIGTAPCLECGAENRVYQNSKNYLYMRGCKQCKSADQRISPVVQTTMFYSLKLGEGAVVERPRNVPETRPDWLDKPAQEPAPVPTPAQVQVPTPQPKKHSSSGPLWVLAAFIGLLATVAGVAVNSTPRSAA
jgi:hypothetical protein